MSDQGAQFLKLAKSLRKLGATRIEAWGFVAEFKPAAVAVMPQQLSLPGTARRAPVPAPAATVDPDRMTPEQRNELRERAYKRELGL